MHLNWVRRTRIGGDGWQAGEVPLGEAVERYRLRAYDAAGTLLSEHEVPSTEASIPADGVARVEVAQLSAAFGAGRAADLEVV